MSEPRRTSDLLSAINYIASEIGGIGVAFLIFAAFMLWVPLISYAWHWWVG